jgi:hypothetical protein
MTFWSFYPMTFLRLVPVLALWPVASAEEVPDFSRDVRPILSHHCFKCHGPDDKTRKGGLRLDSEEEARKAGKSGHPAVVPGDLSASELVARLLTEDEDEIMPPPSAKLELSEEQKSILQRWVKAGGNYEPHWAFVAPVEPALPEVKTGGWVKNAIDRFVLARLEAQGMQPSPEADPVALARRISLDLVGLPPTPEEADAFALSYAANPDAAVEQLVDKLLASPQYGERWTRKWLDLARYADTNGYEKDRERSIWPWRDWVVRALNADMPYDQFTVEQLAGDMLPNPTPDQIIATGFHRNTMINEEGGIDPLEFRYHAMVDRVATTGLTWLGLTTGCAQCHTHKYDPITHLEYFQMMAFLDNADDVDFSLPLLDKTSREEQQAKEAARLLEELASSWPAPEPWEVLPPKEVTAASGEKPVLPGDGSVLFAGPVPATETYTFVLETKEPVIDKIRLEALADAALPAGGPGRVSHGNFVITEVTVTAAPLDQPASGKNVVIASATASAEQEGYPVAAAFDANPATGWAVHQPGGKLNETKTAIFHFREPVTNPGGSLLTIVVKHEFGKEHIVGRPRFSIPPASAGQKDLAGRKAMEAAFEQWLAKERPGAVAWQPITPVNATSNLPLLTIEEGGVVFSSGDTSKSDTYDLVYTAMPGGVTAIRLEALPDPRLPAHGPGMSYYEGPKGDFFLGEFKVSVNGTPVRFVKATESYAKNNFGGNPVTAILATDGDMQTGWSCAGRYGERHEAVFVPDGPVPAGEWKVTMHFGRHFSSSLGKFRLSVTTRPGGAEARSFDDGIHALLVKNPAEVTGPERELLQRSFLLSAPELAKESGRIRSLLQPVTSGQTTLVLQERPPENPRPTYMRDRGEYMMPGEKVSPGVFAFLHPLPEGVEANRLAFARWLVSAENPLAARVAVNRAWAAFFGTGIVKTTEDFGYQSESPTHQDLIDWLAVEFVRQGWSMKKLHKLIVTSATYRQSSKATEDSLRKDSTNRWLGRGPRTRIEAEIVRDSLLKAAGLLSLKMYGPGVRPPQPAGVTEVAYGSPGWNASVGEDRNRRSVYTFVKRTAPFAFYNTFDAPSGEACVARRDVSNTPLQALTLLNDVAVQEAATHLGKQIAGIAGTDEQKITTMFRRVLVRAPQADEVQLLKEFVEAQRARLAAGELKSATAPEEVVFSYLARALFNLDEMVTKP